jgi:uncharacterized protein (DUF2267 family)
MAKERMPHSGKADQHHLVREPYRAAYHVPAEEGPPMGARSLFLAEIESTVALPAGATGEQAAEAVLCSLSLRLTNDELVNLVAVLPGEIGTIFRTCPRHKGQHALPLDRATFLDLVAFHLSATLLEAEVVSRAVMAALRSFIPVEEERQIEEKLPLAIEELWRAA